MSIQGQSFWAGVAPLRRWFALGALVCAGAALRWVNIGAESLWVDEIYSYRQALKSVEEIMLNAPADVHPPTYYLLLHFWTLAFGTSEAGLRSLSAILGVVSVPLMYRLGAALGGGRVGLYAAFFMAISHFHIYYSQEARSYSMVAFVAVLGAWAFVSVARASGVLGGCVENSEENSEGN